MTPTSCEKKQNLHVSKNSRCLKNETRLFGLKLAHSIALARIRPTLKDKNRKRLLLCVSANAGEHLNGSNKSTTNEIVHESMASIQETVSTTEMETQKD